MPLPNSLGGMIGNAAGGGAVNDAAGFGAWSQNVGGNGFQPMPGVQYPLPWLMQTYGNQVANPPAQPNLSYQDWVQIFAGYPNGGQGQTTGYNGVQTVTPQIQQQLQNNINAQMGAMYGSGQYANQPQTPFQPPPPKPPLPLVGPNKPNFFLIRPQTRGAAPPMTAAHLYAAAHPMLRRR